MIDTTIPSQPAGQVKGTNDVHGWFIGIYVSFVPGRFFAQDASLGLFRQIVTSTLRTKGGLIEHEGEPHAVAVCGFFHEIICLAEVSDRIAAFEGITSELSGLEFIANFQLGWGCLAESVWRDYHPKAPMRPFEELVNLPRKWDDQRQKMGPLVKAMYVALGRDPEPPHGPQATL